MVQLQDTNRQQHHRDREDFSSEFPFLRTSFSSRALEAHEAVDIEATAASYVSHESPFVPSSLLDDSNNKFVKENKRAIALISFGESAAESPLLERAIMSVRRKGKFDGPIMVITDAAFERYEGVFDENVFVVNSKKRDMKENYFAHRE